MSKLIFVVALVLALCPAAVFAEAAEHSDTGKLYLDESYLDPMTGEFHIVISLAAATQFMQDLVAGQAKVNYISLPEPRKAGDTTKPAVTAPTNPAIPNIEEITGYTREQLEGMYEYAGPEVVDDMLQERGFASFRDVMNAYDILSGNEPAEDEAEQDEESEEQRPARTR